MAVHHFDGPGHEGESYVTTEVAALWVGISTDAFLRLIGRKKGGKALPGVGEWMRPNPFSKETKWDVLDVICVRNMINKRVAEGAAEDEEEEKP